MVRITYSPRYNIRSLGLKAGHPFDPCRAGNTWRLLRRTLGSPLLSLRLTVPRPAGTDLLGNVHKAEYLTSLRKSETIARVVELRQLSRIPGWLLDWMLLQPMRWAVAGTVVAAEAAMETGLAINLAGGFHHAKPNRGEGFCFYSDIALAIAHLRAKGQLGAGDRVAYIDLDAHQGNGVCHCFHDDARVFIFDMFNEEIYPALDRRARDRIDCAIPLSSGTTGEQYLALLQAKLPPFLDSISRLAQIGLAIYNAGTDVYRDDPLGRQNLTAEDILKRDLFVIEELRRRKISTLMLPSGGYTRDSARLIAATVTQLVKLYGQR